MNWLRTINATMYEGLDALALWLWEKHNLHIKWPVRALAGAYVLGRITSSVVLSKNILGMLLTAGPIIVFFTMLAAFLDHAHFGKQQDQRMTNLRSLMYRTTNIAILLKVALLGLYLLFDIPLFIWPVHGLLYAVAMLMGDLCWFAYLTLLDVIVPTKPPKRKRKPFALPKLKLSGITMPGLQPAGVKTK